MSRPSTLIALAFALASCHRGTIVVVPAPASLAPVLPGDRLYYNDGPAFRDSLRAVVRDRAAWQSLWAQATVTQPAPLPLPGIDFTREVVIAVAGGRMNPGDEIHVDSAGVRDRTFVVVVRTVTECRAFPGDVYPLEIVRVPASDRQVNWVERRQKAAHCQ